jgi:hypothetical protein
LGWTGETTDKPISDILPQPNYVVGDDLIVSFDEEGLNDALHPSVTVSPRGNEYEGTIHVVWDEFDDQSGYREIHYSSSDDEGFTWSHDMDDFLVSSSQKGKANNGDAVNPSVAIDPEGRIHVIWAEQLQFVETWEVFYSFSSDNGRTWSGPTTGDIRISQIQGSTNDARSISPPKLVIGASSGKAMPIFHAIWSEISEKQNQEVIHYSRSFNGGASWTGQEVDDILSPQGEFAREPVIAFSGAEANFIHLSWIQEGPYGFDEIFYRVSADYGNSGSWQEIRPISYLNDYDHMMACNVTLAGGTYNDVHAVWKQYPLGKAPESRLFYSSSLDNGQHWNGIEADYPICDFDGFAPSDPCISVGDRIVQVVWTEVDETSPQNTMEIHTSWTEDPMNPGKWTGLERDIVLSNGDDWGPAHARNASMVMGLMSDGWKPVFVWDELNDRPTEKGGRAEQNNEIHTKPVEWSLTALISGSGTVTKNPDYSSYRDQTQVILTANPSTGWSFDHWGGDLISYSNPDVIIMDSDKSVTAYFSQDQYYLTINVFGSGSVAKSPDYATYTYGQTVTLTATPAFGWRFDHWSGAISGTNNPASTTMLYSTTVNAYFTQNINYVNLTTGWNLVSLPLVQEDTAVSKALLSISGKYDIVKYYDSQDSADPWKSYRPDGLKDLTDINHRMAVWIHAVQPCTLTVYGDIPPSTIIPLYAGWNLVGYPTQDSSKIVSTAFAGTGYDIVEGYQSTSPYIKVLVDGDKMVPGQGYWVHVNSDTTWTINW